MKKVTAIIKPFKLESALAKLPEDGIVAVSVSECRGYGRQKGQLELYKGDEYGLTFLPKARVEVYCEDEVLTQVEDALLTGSRTGRIGDGKMLVEPVEQAEQF